MSANRRTRGLLALGAVVLVLVVLGIYIWRNIGMGPTITQQQAAEQAEKLSQEAIAVLPGKPGFKLVEASTSNCSLPSDNGPQGRVQAFTRYWATSVPVAEFGRYFDLVKEHWTRNGFVVLDDSRPKDWYLWVQHQPDEFRMSIQGNDEGLLSIGAVSPCVWPNGSPEPE